MSDHVAIFDDFKDSNSIDLLVAPVYEKTDFQWGKVKNTTMYPDSLTNWLYGNELTQILFAFTTALVFSAWSYGIIFFFIFLVVWEILYYISVKGTKPFWFLEVRIAIVAASVLGWLVGRELTNKDADRLDPLLGRPVPKDDETEDN